MRTQGIPTTEAAQAVGIHIATLNRWIANGTVAEPPELQLRGGRAVRLWKASDIAQLRKVKAEKYRKGRGRKPRAKK